jgi:hypothetical protein
LIATFLAVSYNLPHFAVAVLNQNPKSIQFLKMAATSATAVRLMNSDPELIHLYLSSDSLSALSTQEVSLLITALSSSEFLRHVYFRNFKSGGTNNQLERFLEAMNTVPTLESLFFHCTEVPLAWLTHILMKSDTVAADTTTTTSRRRGNHLKELGLRYCKLRYQNEVEYQAFEQALRQHSTLQDVCLECCEWQVEEHNDNNNNNNNNNSNKTNSFLKAIAQIPTLTNVECVLYNLLANISSRKSEKRLPVTTLQTLGRIPQLQSLRLRNFWLPEQDVALLCHSLMEHDENHNGNNTPKPLRKLILSCDLGTTSALALAQLVQQPQSMLQQLSLRVDNLYDPDCPQFLAQALRQSNSTLVHFHLSGTAASLLSPQAKQAFCDMMQTNVSLEFVRLDVNDYHLQSQVAFYLQLGHKGRRELFRALQQQQQQQQHQQQQQEESQLWIRALCQNATHLPALHHFVGLNPGFFALAALEQLKRQKQQPPRQHASLFEDGIDYDLDGWQRSK